MEKTKLSKSNRLRKIETIYNKYINLFNTSETTTQQEKQTVKEKKVKENSFQSKKEVCRKKPLNDYQKFVQKESKKDIYKYMSAKERFSSISNKF
jgi:hypothetical protein